jgi:uncharacterized membrane protein
MSEDTPHADRREGRLHHLAHRLAEEDASDTLHPGTRLAMTVGPLVGFGIILLVAVIVSGYRASAVLFTAEVGSFIGGGKFVILWGLTPKSTVSVWWLAAMVVYGDVATALVLMANMRVFYRMPWLGRRLASCHEAGWYVLHANPWMRRVAWLGVAIYVGAPFQGTGAVVGTLIARILGESRLATLSATLVGSTAGCVLLAAIGTAAGEQLQKYATNPVIVVATLVTTLAALVLVGRWFTGQAYRAKAKLAEQADEA